MGLGLGQTRGPWESEAGGSSQSGGATLSAREAPGAPDSRRALEASYSGPGKSNVAVARTLDLSDEAGPLTLSFWIRLSDTSRQSGLALEAEVGGTTTVLGAAAPGRIGSAWYPVELDLSAYAGASAVTLRWRATGMDGGEDRLWLDEVAVRRGNGTSTVAGNLLGAPGGSDAAPTSIELSEPYPNPSTSGVSLSLALPEAADVRVEVYDALGRRALPAASAAFTEGRHRLPISTEGLPAGTYFARVGIDTGAEHEVLTHSFVLVR